MNEINSYPFERGPIDFKIKPPTSLQKKWMASQIPLGKEDPRVLVLIKYFYLQNNHNTEKIRIHKDYFYNFTNIFH